MLHWSYVEPRPQLVQIMACRLFGATPLSERMLYYCQLGHWEQISVNLDLKFKPFHSRKCIWKCRLANVGHVASASRCLRVLMCIISYDKLAHDWSRYRDVTQVYLQYPYKKYIGKGPQGICHHWVLLLYNVIDCGSDPQTHKSLYYW